MKIQGFDTDKEIFIVAEIGNNHEGSFDLACRMIEEAARAGVNAVKFQTFRSEHLCGGSDPARGKQLKKFELPFEQFKRLAEVARRNNVMFFSTPLDDECVDFLKDFVPVFKIASGDNDYRDLIEKIAGTGKPIIMSAGMATIEECGRSVSCIKKVWEEKNIQSELALLHCVSAYPVPNEQANLSMITHMKEVFPGCTVGYSDHTVGIDAAIAAAQFGAKVIEKHFTIDRNYSSFRDHQLSADPSEMKTLVDRIRSVESRSIQINREKYAVYMGDAVKEVMPCEEPVRQAARRSAFAGRNLKKGQLIVAGDIRWLRPGGDFSAYEPEKIIGKILKSDIKAGDAIVQAALESETCAA